jgi:AcrR family transcriptional regulator
MHVTQAQRRARSREALLESAAQGISRFGYGDLILERVAADAGYTRGALYHQFADKEELALAVVEWVAQSWLAEVGSLAEAESDPLAALLALARGHAVYCRRDVARVLTVLRVEFNGRDHPVGQAVDAAYETLLRICKGLISAGQRVGAIPTGPPVGTLALAFIGAVEGTVIQLAGESAHDELLVERVALGLLTPGSGSSFH